MTGTMHIWSVKFLFKSYVIRKTVGRPGLPDLSPIHAANSIDSFKTQLKTYLFSKAYSAVSWL